MEVKHLHIKSEALKLRHSLACWNQLFFSLALTCFCQCLLNCEQSRVLADSSMPWRWTMYVSEMQLLNKGRTPCILGTVFFVVVVVAGFHMTLTISPLNCEHLAVLEGSGRWTIYASKLKLLNQGRTSLHTGSNLFVCAGIHVTPMVIVCLLTCEHVGSPCRFIHITEMDRVLSQDGARFAH